MNPEVQQQLFAGLQDSPSGVALFDPGERLRYANGWFRSAFGLAADSEPTWEQMMRDCHRSGRGVLVETDDIDVWIARVRQSFRQQPQRCFESDLVDGRWLSVTETLRPDGWLTLTCTDVSRLKADAATLRKARDEAVIASLTDPLTELYNRRFIFKRLHDVLASAAAMRIPLCAAAIDLDHFKSINDRHGHQTGDRVLCSFAHHLRHGLRPLDAAGRIGGEEFLLVMPNTTIGGALNAVERLRSALSRPPDEAGAALPHYTFSAGVAAATPHDTVESLFSRVDAALYRAKAAGRNGTVACRDLGQAEAA